MNRRRSDPKPDCECMPQPIPQPLLIMLHEEPLHESPYQHLANAVQLLFLAEARLADLMTPPDQMLVDLIHRAEARCFHAIFALGQEEA